MLLEAESIVAGYGHLQVLHGVTLGVAEGQICSLVGSNGAGKTTLMRVVSGLVTPLAGRVRFAGEDVTAMAAHRRVELGIAHVPEGRWIFRDMTVDENLRIGAFRRGRARSARGIERVYAFFPRLKERRRQIAGTMSGGEQQMAAIGRALMSEPRLLILDEPSLGLAPIVVQAALDAVRAVRDEGVSVLIVEQNVNMVLPMSDHAYVMENGVVSIQGSGKQLMGDPAVARAYLGGG